MKTREVPVAKEELLKKYLWEPVTRSTFEVIKSDLKNWYHREQSLGNIVDIPDDAAIESEVHLVFPDFSILER